MKRTLSLSGMFALALVVGCSAGNGGSGGPGSGGSAGSPSAGGSGGNGQGGSGQGASDGGLFGNGGGFAQGQGGGTGTECVAGPDEDKDKDGFSINAGDCNDCDANVSPGSIEVIITEPDMNGVIPPPADEDCNGVVDDPLGPCDDGLTLADTDPMNGAKTIELCQAATADGKWGVMKAGYVRANGTSATPPNPLQYGIFDNFGPNVTPQGGKKILGLSSGYARIPGQPNACGSLSCYSNQDGTPPPAGFPQDVAGCAGATDIDDDVALELQIRSPKNATGYKFNFKFYSFEYPEWVCTSFNDQYISLVNPAPPGSISGNISFDKQNNPVSVNVAFFDVCDGCALGTAELAGNGYDSWDDAGGTGWLVTTAPITGGDEFTIRFAIWDTGDAAWDSTALVDNFQWIADGGTVVVATEPEIPK